MRLDLNLASRPFVNRMPHAILLGTLAAAAVGLTAWNAALFARSRAEKNAVESQLTELAREEESLRARRAEVQARLAGTDLEPLIERVDTVNAVLSEKAVSWSLLLERLEEILPWPASLRSIGTSVGTEGIKLDLEVSVADYDDALTFIDDLEQSPCFSDVYPMGERREDGIYELQVETTHDPYCGQAPPAPKRKARAIRGGRRG